MRLIAIVLVGSLVIGGCATAGAPSTATPVADGSVVDVRQQCHASAAGSVESGVLKSALTTAGLASLYLVLRGAGEGAFWGAVAGADVGKGAWIGAAVGAGLGTLAGVVVGVKDGVTAYGQYRDAYDACIASHAPQES